MSDLKSPAPGTVISSLCPIKFGWALLMTDLRNMLIIYSILLFKVPETSSPKGIAMRGMIFYTKFLLERHAEFISASPSQIIKTLVLGHCNREERSGKQSVSIFLSLPDNNVSK